MIELKEWYVDTIEDYGHYVPYYEKSEADKVIAKLDRQIEFLKVTTGACKDCNKCADGMGKVFDKELDPLKDKLRNQKYKRCLAMAKWCDSSMAYFGEFYNDASKRMVDYYYKWRKRWYTIAEQFKE